MFFTLQNLQHFIRSAYGVSTKSFLASEVHPVAIQGIGQGNGAGPQIWAAISTVILNLLRTQQAGAVFEAPITGESLRLARYAYVDDTDIIAHDKNGKDNAVMELQRSINLWNGGVAATGGQLEPTKTYWYNMQFKWKDGNWSYGSKSEYPATLTMADASGRTTLEQVEVSEGRRTLGVRLAPDGNNNAEFAYLKGECDQWADKIRSGMLSQKYTWQAFSSTILAKLAYALPATTFSKVMCEAITRRLIFATLSRSGINPHISRDLVFGSPQRLGLGFPELYVTQGAQAIARIVSYGTIKTGITSKLLWISYELLCIETGLARPLEEDFNELGKLSVPCFFTSIWEFIDMYKIVLYGPRSPVRILRQHDTMIMEKIKGKLDKYERGLFNQCRIYLKVLLVSDMTTADGRFISWYAMRGLEDTTRASKWKWPEQGKPSKLAWVVWQKGIDTLGVRDRSGRIQLHQTLGKWILDECNGWLLDTTSDRLLNQTTGQIYLKKTGRPTRQSNAQFKLWTGTDEQFHGDQRVNVIRQPNGDVQLESRFTGELLSKQPKGSTFYEYVQRNEQWDWWREKLQYEESELAHIIRDIVSGNGITVSDGSYKDNHGTASIILEGATSGRKVTTSVIVPGSPELQCAYRSEAAGIAAALQVVNALAGYFGITTGRCTLGCDGKSTLDQCFWVGNKTPTEIPHFDIVAVARAEIVGSVVVWKGKYIPGHQSVFPLDREATLNEEMDQACKQHWTETQNSGQIWFHEVWRVSNDGTKIGSNLTKEIQSFCAIKRAERYWENKNGEVTENMDWVGVQYNVSSTPRHRRQWMTKHSSGFCSVGKMAQRIGLRNTDQCPRCEQPETTEHVWRCRHPEADQLWEDSMVNLRAHLGGLQTPSSIINAILDGLQGWRNGVDHIFNGNTTAGQAGTLQNQMGWKHMFEGRPHKIWRQLQTTHYGSERLGKRWVGELVKKTWQIAWDLWEHRNGILHDKNIGYCAQETDDKIRKLLWDPHVYRITSIRDLLTENEETICGWGLSQKQIWVVRVEAALARFRAQQDE
jgi:hypothetical protein